MYIRICRVDVNYIRIFWGCLTLEDVDRVADASERYAASIFRMEVCKNVCIVSEMDPKIYKI
jgi:AraC-like DNA-binding protein